MRIYNITAQLFLATLTVITPSIASACSTCSSSFNSEWASQGYSDDAGVRFDARYDFINQNNLRHKTKKVSKTQYTSDHQEEIQQQTITRQYLLSLDYSWNKDWGLRVSAPLINRTHVTKTGEDSMHMHRHMQIESGSDLQDSSSKSAGLGDVQVVGRYQGFLSDSSFGIQYGLKIPTGTFTDSFYSGPLSGERIDRGLQNGTGTTDLITGIYKFGSLSDSTEYFAQSLFNQSLNNREGFKPSTKVMSTIGIGYNITQNYQAQLQLNHVHEWKQSGINSDRDNSGSNVLYLTPGISSLITEKTTIYTLIQIPIYENVNGLQLQPTAIYSAGLRYNF